jgi:hypothetical protein
MSIFTEPGASGGGRRRLFLALLIAAAVVVLALVLWLLARRPAPAPKAPPPPPRARTTPAPRPTPSAPAAPAARATPRPEPRPEAVATVLRVDSDVPGANVFLDRKFLGTTPVETRDFEPGTHRINASADGYDMFGETIDLEAGENTLTIRFKEVRLDERVDVVHKHGVGSCRGRLVATTAGLRFESEKAGDSFEAPFASLEPLQVDYLNRNLRVKQRGGKTWNFTADSADALLAFQKAVEKARARL